MLQNICFRFFMRYIYHIFVKTNKLITLKFKNMANIFIVFYSEINAAGVETGEGVIEVEAKGEKISPRATKDLIMSLSGADVADVKITSTKKLTQEEYKLFKKM